MTSRSKREAFERHSDTRAGLHAPRDSLRESREWDSAGEAGQHLGADLTQRGGLLLQDSEHGVRLSKAERAPLNGVTVCQRELSIRERTSHAEAAYPAAPSPHDRHWGAQAG